MKKQPEKLETLLKCIPESPFKKQLIIEIMNTKKESYIQGSNDYHSAIKEENGKLRKIANAAQNLINCTKCDSAELLLLEDAVNGTGWAGK